MNKTIYLTAVGIKALREKLAPGQVLPLVLTSSGIHIASDVVEDPASLNTLNARPDRTITLTFGDNQEGGGYKVQEGDTYHYGLTFDEMIGQVIELAHPNLGTGRYPMLTEKQWKEQESRWKNKSQTPSLPEEPPS